MAQYRVGTISVTSGSADVSGSGTLWDSIGIAGQLPLDLSKGLKGVRNANPETLG